jgi:hypothetical protein
LCAWFRPHDAFFAYHLSHIGKYGRSLLQVVEQAGILGALVFAVLGPTVFSFSALSYSSRKLKPSINSAYITLQPVLVAIMSLVLFGNVLTSQELEAGLLVLIGLYFTIIGNPKVDREWKDYVSDLPTNVPQTLSNVADAVVDVKDVAVDAVVETVVDTVSDIKSGLRELVGSETEDNSDEKDAKDDALQKSGKEGN